jgi:hypothetical protein
MRAAMSVRAAAIVAADAAVPVTPFVIEAGLTFATAATVESTNWTSRNAVMPFTSSSRTAASADGVDIRPAPRSAR